MSIALLLIFLALMCLGVPIAISLGAASVIVLITMGNMPLTMVVQLMYTYEQLCDGGRSPVHTGRFSYGRGRHRRQDL